MGQQGRLGPRPGVSVLTTERAKPFSGSRGYGKGRIRRPDGGEQFGVPPVHGSPSGQPMPPSIGPNEPRGPADLSRGDRRRRR